MAAEFVPFLASFKRESDSAASSANPARAPAPADFAPVRPEPTNRETVAESAPVRTGTPPHSPTVTLQREGDRVTRIQVQCACGEVIELDCEY
jgi:hypothetical protein